MRIGLVVGGKFHAFNLAEQLNNEGCLKTIITSYPKSYLIKHGIKKNLIKSLVSKEIFLKFLNRIKYMRNFFDYEYFLCNYFDDLASKLIEYEELDILVGWSGFSKKSFLNASKYNCIKILERGSSHIKFQEEILKNEYLKLGIRPTLPSKKMIQKELEEYQLADFISVPSDFVKQSFIKYGILESKIIKIPYGVDLKEFEVISNEKKKIKKFTIITTGTISFRKGSHYLIETFQELSLSDAELIFVGPIDYEFKDWLRKKDNLINIKFVKKKKQSELKYLYNNSNLFVQCSIEEGLSMVQAQAMACGIPVICTENSGGAEIINDGQEGFIIPIRNKEILKKKILELYNDRKKLDLMSEKAHKSASKNLSWKLYGKKMIETYKNIIREKSK